jgi:hypothetical protein
LVRPIFDKMSVRVVWIFQVPKSWQSKYPGAVARVLVTSVESSDAAVYRFNPSQVSTRSVKPPVSLGLPWTGLDNQRWSDRDVIREPFIKIGPDDVRLAAGFGGATSSRSGDRGVVDVRDTVEIAHVWNVARPLQVWDRNKMLANPTSWINEPELQELVGATTL